MSSFIFPDLQQHLDMLSRVIGPRPVGSAGNLRAEAYIAQQLEAAGYEVRHQHFECDDWKLRSASVEIDGVSLPVRSNSYSMSCDVCAPIVMAHTFDELKSLDLHGCVVVLHGGLSADPWQPRHFRFFSIKDQLRLREELERAQPLAVITISPRNEHVRPIIEDGDFHIPSVTVNSVSGARLVASEGHLVHMRIDSWSQPSTGANVIADSMMRPRGLAPQVLLCAHYDTKHESPGALDNASGVAPMLVLAQHLATRRDVELQCVALNGHDHFATPGQNVYQSFIDDACDSLDLVINFDDIGYQTTSNTVAFMNCTDRFVQHVRELMSAWPDIFEIGPWPQGDHAAFWSAGVPSVAFTSEASFTLPDRVTHTPLDVVENVNTASIADVVDFAEHALIRAIISMPARRRRDSAS